ncbi:hypothetical protein Tco_0340961 [Tanacetum coccineum]
MEKRKKKGRRQKRQKEGNEEKRRKERSDKRKEVGERQKRRERRKEKKDNRERKRQRQRRKEGKKWKQPEKIVSTWNNEDQSNKGGINQKDRKMINLGYKNCHKALQEIYKKSTKESATAEETKTVESDTIASTGTVSDPCWVKTQSTGLIPNPLENPIEVKRVKTQPNCQRQLNNGSPEPLQRFKLNRYNL